MDPWLCELVVVKNGSHYSSERQSLTRDVAHGMLVRVRQGVYVHAAIWRDLGEHGRRIVRMRALDAVSTEVPVFSHWSAAVALGLDFSAPHLDRVHVTRPGGGDRAPFGVAPHFHPLDPTAVIDRGGLLLTDLPRTVVDIAGASPFNHGVTTADAAMRAGVSREQLLTAWDAAGMRRAYRRTEDVILFAHPGSESANESESRCSMMRMHIEPPELQVEVFDDFGFTARLDFLFRRHRVGGEADGAKKYLDPDLARDGTGRALFNEKLREERARAVLADLVRWGWPQSCDPVQLRAVLARAGVRPFGATFSDYCGAAAAWQPGAVIRAETPVLK